ncbi:ChrR family anti-sigma-E factor [Pseudoalteromonas tunicata]|jgi:putative transcriptional regulator|uniref:Putative transcriptional activator n=1 Tax=Pseudoalteromonas tunicata D2 TaxID=87626 RepID=A4C4A4_9GAMM|nr:ChrR family anti-sigma-E factor [Pseudoalteromonas tunicata]ATC97132.1 putative transcriptional regulator [Pseudoalteromonas tunicata]AXT33239.1 transcriptional regulator [Pseudoalteromonas tunicata]EAR30386.1 putative transcriptional activator [Pseudoalteromonas tunicata D2]MDP4984785.1 ChrR family anti-sigma-E factor [Pseudoalteromonas tunicata]MDP5214168.1 ChrR family anti-sigma-E factor [Pseudoalteromonas tunicata]
MIKFHPKLELLQSYVLGELPASLTAAISMHADFCQECAKQITQLTCESADTFDSPLADFSTKAIDINDAELSAMMHAICDNDDIYEAPVIQSPEIELKGNVYSVPRALRSLNMSGWYKMGKLSRARIDFNEGALHSSLLHIDQGGSVPMHTHKGFELTLLLDGSFSDDMGHYEKGDFILLDGKHTHNPMTETGCLCFTVADDALHFTQGLSKLLNPLGSFIY